MYCAAFLARALDPPAAASVDAALARSRRRHALYAAGRLSALGRRLARLPLEPKVGSKMQVLGALLGCVDPMLTVAAAAGASRSPFLSLVDRA